MPPPEKKIAKSSAEFYANMQVSKEL